MCLSPPKAIAVAGKLGRSQTETFSQADEIGFRKLSRRPSVGFRGCLAHKKLRPFRTLQWDYAYGLTVVLGGGRFLMSEVPL